MKKVYSRVGVLVLVASLPFLGAPHAAAADGAAPAQTRKTYDAYCSKCHGEQGKGDGAGAAMLNPKPRDFANCQDMKKRSDAELFKVISEGGDAVGMSGDMIPWGGTLSDDQIHGLVTFVRSFCKQP